MNFAELRAPSYLNYFVAVSERTLQSNSFQTITMSTPTAKRIVVCGGNGFLGSRICKAAVTRGWDVTSIR